MPITARSQSAGIGEVTAIEALAARIKANRETITQYKAELIQLDATHTAKVQKLKDELAALMRDRDAHIAELKAGVMCSECNRTKTEIERAGINFQAHLRDVKGFAKPAPTERIEKDRADFAVKIAYKRVQIQQVENGPNPATSKRQAIANLEKQTEELCRQI